MKKKNIMKISVIICAVIFMFSSFMIVTNAGSYNKRSWRSFFNKYYNYYNSSDDTNNTDSNETPTSTAVPGEETTTTVPEEETSENNENDTSDEETSDNSEDDTSNEEESNDSASYYTNSDGTIVVESGTFNGGGESFGDVGDGSQSESQPAVFELEVGANLTNCVIEPPAGDGIHVHGDNNVSNIVFTDVGEDAISMRSDFEGGEVTISDCSFTGAEDKVFQVNTESTWRLNNITVDGAGKVMRQNGGTTFPLTVYIDGLNATDINEAIVRSDSSDCTVYYSNITCNLDESDWWYGDLTAIAE
jgi:pectate lyase C